MSIVLLSSFEESKGRGGWGYVNGASSSFMSSVGTSIFGSTKQDIKLEDAETDVDINDVITQVNMSEVTGLEVDAMGE